MERLKLLDSPPEDSFDRLTRLVNQLLGVPVSLLSLIEADRQFLLSQAGLGEPWASSRQSPLTHCFSELVAAGRAPLSVADARLEERLAADLAIRELGAISYAGVPIFMNGDCVGSLCAVDTRPRTWRAEELRLLEEVAATVGDELRLREALADRDEARAALDESENHIRLAFDAAAVGMLMVSIDPSSSGRILRANRALRSLLGREEDELTGALIEDVTHPGDRDFCGRTLQALVDGDSQLVRRLEARYLHRDGHIVWGALTATTVVEPGGRPPYVIALIEDVSEQKQAEHDLPAIANVLRRILSGEDAREAIVQAALDIAGAASAYLVEPVAGSDHLIVTACAGATLKGVQIPLGEPSVTARSYLDGEATFLADPHDDPQVSTRLLELCAGRSIMWQPIFSHSEVIGVLVVCWKERVSDLSARAARAVALLTDETAVALAHHDALRKLASQATTDGLTGLPNRRAWDQRLARDLASARRLQRPITLALVDMDRFKHYNDTQGHAAGDALLREFARRARVLLREGDTFARWGGEEFGVLLPDCPSSSFAESILDRIRNAVPEGQSCSVGYATWDGLESPEELVMRADRALYRAKAMGRDRAAAAEDPSPLAPSMQNMTAHAGHGRRKWDQAPESPAPARTTGAPWRPQREPLI